MKRTDKVTSLVAILLFLALMAYMGVYAFGAISDRTITAQAVTTEVSVGGVASGIVIREETVLTSQEKYIDVSTADGTKIRAGQVLATAMSSETGLERAGRIRELEMEIGRISTLLSSLDSVDDLTARDERLSRSVRDLTTAVARHQLDGLDSAALNLRSLLFGTGETATEDQLQALQAELQSLRNSSSSDTEELLAEESGTFSSVTDGYEWLSLSQLKDLSPAGLENLIQSPGEIPPGAYGKLVSGHNWYFAAVMSYEDASNLSVGRYATLDFGRWYGSLVYAQVHQLSPVQDGKVAVVFRCDTALEDMLGIRQASANVVFEEYSGIRVPSQAIRTDSETQGTYVWVITAMVLERKDVNIIYAGDGFVVVERSTEADALREGNTIVVEGRDLHEGKVMD